MVSLTSSSDGIVAGAFNAVPGPGHRPSAVVTTRGPGAPGAPVV